MSDNVSPNANAQGGLIAIGVVMVALAVIAVLLRTVAVLNESSRKLGLDDLFVTLSLPFYIGVEALIFWWVKLGLGRPDSTVPLSDLAQAGKIVFASGYLFNTGLALPKFSVLCFYNRVFGDSTRWFYVLIWVAAALNFAWLTTTYFVAGFRCTPTRASWDTVKGSTCIPIGRIYIGTSVVSTVIDFIIILMPVPLLLHLRTTTIRKALVLMIFICGYCVIFTSLGRLVTVAQVGAGLTEDITWSDVTYIKWVQCEGALSITSACLPNIFSFARRIHRRGVHAKSRPYSGSVPPSKSRHEFRRMGRDPDESILRTTEWNATVQSVKAGPFGSEEELRTLSVPQTYFIGRGDVPQT